MQVEGTYVGSIAPVILRKLAELRAQGSTPGALPISDAERAEILGRNVVLSLLAERRFRLDLTGEPLPAFPLLRAFPWAGAFEFEPVHATLLLHIETPPAHTLHATMRDDEVRLAWGRQDTVTLRRAR